jgi:serralysin
VSIPTYVPTSLLVNGSSVIANYNRYWLDKDLTYSLPSSAASWPAYAGATPPFDAAYAALSAGQQGQFRAAMAAWDVAYPGVLREVNEDAELGQIRVAFSGDFRSGLPPSGWPSGGKDFDGDIFLPASMRSSSLAPLDDAWDFARLLREIGISLGFANFRSNDGDAFLGEFNTTRFTVMTTQPLQDFEVFAGVDAGFGEGRLTHQMVGPTTPMVLDIFQMEVAYTVRHGGAMNANLGDTIYSFAPGAPLMQTILDTGGVDTIDLSNHTRPSTILLEGGSYSSVDYYPAAQQMADIIARFPNLAADVKATFNSPNIYEWSANVAIAYKTVIENVRAGSGDDRVIGNAADNVISGGAGQDYLRGEGGADSLSGGADFDDINGNTGNDTASGGDGEDWVVGGKDNDSLSGDAAYDLVYGNLGNDTCDGGAGNDIVRGGQDDDLCRGGDGDDYVSGDKGSDTMTGGLGADVFHTFGEAGIDRVTDFSLAQGDRVQLDPGTQYTLSQSGADTVINMTGGGQMILVGVQMSSLTPGWIFGA